MCHGTPGTPLGTSVSPGIRSSGQQHAQNCLTLRVPCNNTRFAILHGLAYVSFPVWKVDCIGALSNTTAKVQIGLFGHTLPSNVNLYLFADASECLFFSQTRRKLEGALWKSGPLPPHRMPTTPAHLKPRRTLMVQISISILNRNTQCGCKSQIGGRTGNLYTFGPPLWSKYFVRWLNNQL